MAKKKKRADGRYSIQIYLGTVDGKRKTKTVYGATKAEAEEAALQVKLKLRKGIDVSADRDSFEIWANRWKKSKFSSISASRATVYQSALSKLEPLYPMKITQVKTYDIQEIISNLAKTNPNTGKPSSRKLLLEVRSVASQVFGLAIENRVLDFNPAQYVRIPAAEIKQERRALTPEEQSWIIKTPHRMQIGAMIMMLAGLRRGELIPLTWGDIDLDKQTITVNKAVEIVNGKTVVKPQTKTAAGMRTVNIPSLLKTFLIAHKPEDVTESTIVLKSAHGKMLTESAWKRLWESYWCELNFRYGGFPPETSKYDPAGLPPRIPKFTAHWLRHTFVTLMYLSGVDVATAMMQAGHADIQTTLGIYTHLNNQYQKDNMSKMDDFLSSQIQVSEKSCDSKIVIFPAI